MDLKVVVIFLLVGACYALPVDETKLLEVAPTLEPVPLELTPAKVEALPAPPKPDNSDLKPDASTWWHSWWHHEYPPYYYDPNVPHYTYWKTHW